MRNIKGLQMTNYTTSDFSEIHGPDEKPTVPGWYVSAANSYCVKSAHEYSDLNEPDFGYWDGEVWTYGAGNSYFTGKVCSDQSRYWFGLREKP